MEAVEKFLSENDEFVVDERCERFLMTQNPRGYLRRTEPTKATLEKASSAQKLSTV
jgi:hypothetical protein